MASLSSLVLAEGERDAPGRARLQSYETMPLFLPSRLWRQILDCQEPGAKTTAAVEAIGQLCLFLHRLGLRYPSEPSFAHIFVLLNGRVQLSGMNPQQLAAALRSCKGCQNWLVGSKGGKGGKKDRDRRSRRSPPQPHCPVLQLQAAASGPLQLLP